MSIESGMYVKFKGEAFLCLIVETSGAVIINPKRKTKVNVKNLVAMNCKPATHVSHENGEYMVTVTKVIVSFITNKIMKWLPGNGNRVAILAAAGLAD